LREDPSGLAGIVTERLRGWRRIAAAIWRPPPPDPVMVGDFDLHAAAALEYLEAVRASTGERVSMTHLVGRAIAHALAAHPDLNRVLSGDRMVPRGSVDVAFIVAYDEGRQHAGVTITGADRKTVAEICRELDREAAALRSPGGGPGRAVSIADHLPLWLIRGVLRVLVWLAVDRRVDLTRFGLPAYGLRPGGFGSALVSSVGMLGIDRAQPGITPLARVPIAVLVGRITDRPVVVDGEVVAGPVATISAAVDHRHYDGSHVGRLLGDFRAYLEDPAAFDPPG
jgi:pyruvate dehydrogenase E2 component (dihydrolipoamide acetyltransferase)